MNLSKTIFLRLKFLERLDNFFHLSFSYSFSILSRWLLILINQFKFTFALALLPKNCPLNKIIFHKVPLVVSPDIFFPFYSNPHPISSPSFQTSPPQKKFFFASKPFGIKLKDSHISRKTIWYKHLYINSASLKHAFT